MNEDEDPSWAEYELETPDEASEDDDDDDDTHETDERMRQDDTDGEWYTKDQFYEYYGSDRIWEAMHPEKQMKRSMIERVFQTYGHLSRAKLELFLDEVLDTYK